jgi:hypothetical protein
MNKKIIPAFLFLLAGLMLIGYQNCSSNKFGISSRNVSFSCSPVDVNNFLQASWIPLTVKLGDLSVYGNDGSFYPPMNTQQVFWVESNGSTTPLCNGNVQADCQGSDYDLYSYFGDYAQVATPTTPATLTSGYTSAKYISRIPRSRDNLQNARTMNALVNRWCKAQKDSQGHALYSTGYTNFEINEYLPSTFSPNDSLAVNCAAIEPAVADTCSASYANNPPVVTENYQYTNEYQTQCSSVLADSSQSNIEKNQNCGNILCQGRGYQTGYVVEWNAFQNLVLTVCFHDANFYSP